MGMTFEVDSIEGMCDLMCDNNIFSDNVREVKDMNRENYYIVDLLDALWEIRGQYEGTMTDEQLTSLYDAISIIDKNFDNDILVDDIINKVG